jgi:general L-amino acid transport system permease protein
MRVAIPFEDAGGAHVAPATCAQWMRRNASTVIANVVLLALFVYLAWRFIPALLDWAVVQASFAGNSRAACHESGACWTFITAHWRPLLYGGFPSGERWRVNLVAVIFIVFMALLIFRRIRGHLRLPIILFSIFPLVALPLLLGGVFGLTEVPTDDWGGVMLDFVLSYSAIAGALPGGILLALGRRSRLPLVRAICVMFIEFFRAIPLLAVLFTALIILPIALPAQLHFDKLSRAIVALTIFYAAYLAEVVRGGLQALPAGQVEAAHSLGIGYWRTTALVVLPQALRMVIPAMVNTIIELIKDSTIVTIIGLFDLLGMIRQALSDPNWLGYSTEGYSFAALFFFCICFGLSSYSQRLESRLGRRQAQALLPPESVKTWLGREVVDAGAEGPSL